MQPDPVEAGKVQSMDAVAWVLLLVKQLDLRAVRAGLQEWLEIHHVAGDTRGQPVPHEISPLLDLGQLIVRAVGWRTKGEYAIRAEFGPIADSCKTAVTIADRAQAFHSQAAQHVPKGAEGALVIL